MTVWFVDIVLLGEDEIVEEIYTKELLFTYIPYFYHKTYIIFIYLSLIVCLYQDNNVSSKTCLFGNVCTTVLRNMSHYISFNIPSYPFSNTILSMKIKAACHGQHLNTINVGRFLQIFSKL